MSIRETNTVFRDSLIIRPLTLFGSCKLLSSLAPLNGRGCFIVGICAELSAIVARFAVRFFTDDAKILRVISPTARFIGGYYLGNMALIAFRFHPVPFVAATVAIMLPTFILQTILSTRPLQDESIRRVEMNGCL